MTRDCWAEWLATRRHGGDEEVRREFASELGQRREKLLDRAELAAGETLLDVGCGEGLIGFGAVDRGAEVVFSDVSEDLLHHCRDTAESLGVLERCRFVPASADDLSSLAGETVDVVTTRSVLIYVADKPGAFREFFRVLRPGGRISLFEPINRFGHPEPPGRFCGFDVGPVADVAAKVRSVFRDLQPKESDPMLDFDERDLLAACESAGFFPIDLELQAELRPLRARSWETFLNTAGNPKIPTFGEAMEQALDPDERTRLTAHLRPLVEAGDGTWRMAHAWLKAWKPVARG
jgi:ubiquinone/menaquinone biosynthesis C-methylase UbiE